MMKQLIKLIHSYDTAQHQPGFIDLKLTQFKACSADAIIPAKVLEIRAKVDAASNVCHEQYSPGHKQRGVVHQRAACRSSREATRDQRAPCSPAPRVERSLFPQSHHAVHPVKRKVSQALLQSPQQRTESMTVSSSACLSSLASKSNKKDSFHFGRAVFFITFVWHTSLALRFIHTAGKHMHAPLLPGHRTGSSRTHRNLHPEEKLGNGDATNLA